MAKRNFTFLKSNYTLRTKHKSLNKKDSAIYVRDYMVTTNNGGWDSGSIPYGENNFKMVHRFDEKEARKHSYGKWLSNGNSDVWTLKDIENGLSNNENIKEINRKMVMNTSYKSLLDFAYFGNCTEMVKSSVTDIINKFPGELYVTNNEFSYYNEKEDKIIKIVGDKSNGHDELTTLYYIDNPFSLDIFTMSISPTTENKLKYFCLSRNSYKVLNKYETPCGIDMQRWVVEMQPNIDLRCLKEGQFIAKVLLLGQYDSNKGIVYKIDYSQWDKKLYSTSTFIIYVYFQGGKFVYLTDSVWEGYHIRLSDEKIEAYFQNELDDFERFLLNRNTKPRYLIEIDTLKENESGFKKGSIKLNWPTLSGGWNLDVESEKYVIYIEKLLEQSQLYDEYFSNNLWRMMTHDSIKNMDLTFGNEKLNEDKYDYNIGISKIEGLFWAYGREFDDLKRYIENLKSINNISYSENGQIAESVLYEKCGLNGWELYNPIQYLKNDTEVKQLYYNQFKTYTIYDVKDRFFTELFINSKNIFSRKGTKYGIEMLLSLFGFCSYDYGKNSYKNLSPNEQIEGKVTWDELDDGEKQLYYDYTIDEYVAVVTNKSSDVLNANEEFPCEKYNALKSGFVSPDEFTMDADSLEGLPVREVNFITKNGDLKRYIIPWYDKIQYSNNKMYFQMYGGWGKISLKDIDEKIHVSPSIIKEFKELRTTDDFKIYSETLKYIKIKDNIQDLLRTDYSTLNEGDIYYIERPIGEEYHYYVLIDKENSGSLKGWKAITEEDFENNTENALKIIYLESIVDDYRANNPHVGYGKYDDGNEYLEYFRHLFKYEIENSTTDKPLFTESAYDCNTGDVLAEINDCGFTIGDIIKDNVKVWYFTPSNTINEMNMSANIGKYPSTASNTITVSKVSKEKNKIKGMDTWSVSFSKSDPFQYYSVLTACDMKYLDFNTEYTIGFWIKNTDNATIRIKPKLAKVRGIKAFVSKEVEDSDASPYETIVLGLNEERYVEFTGYPFDEQHLQIFIQPEYKNENTNEYYKISYFITQVFVRQENYMETLYKNTENGIYEVGNFNGIKEIKVGAMANNTIHYESDLLPFNLETQEVYSNDEAAANSIINVKNLKITFANKYTNFEGFRTYLYGSVVPYLTQLIPSTTILNIDFECVNIVQGVDIVTGDIVQGVGIV